MDEHVLAEQTAIVTGASRGIGKVIARRFAANGAATIVCSRSQDRIETAAADIEQHIEDDNAGSVYPVKRDVTSERAVREVVDATLAEFDGIDILINNAGGSRGEDGRIHSGHRGSRLRNRYPFMGRFGVSHFYRIDTQPHRRCTALDSHRADLEQGINHAIRHPVIVDSL